MFVTDGDGVVVAKLLHDPYKKRDSAEVIIDAALGRFKLQKTRRLYRWLLTMEEWSAPPLMAVLEACHSESSVMWWCRIARGAAYLWGTRPGRHGPDHYTGERPPGLVSETWILLPIEPRKCDTLQAAILQADVVRNLSVQTAANAWSRSAIMSSICSMPIDRRT